MERLAGKAASAADAMSDLPSAACPGGEAVGVLTMHPQAIAKSYFPQQLLAQFNLRHVGSRPVEVQPDQWTRQDELRPVPSTELFIAGHREAFRRLADDIGDLANAAANGADVESRLRERARTLPDELTRLENIRVQSPSERLRMGSEYEGQPIEALEVVLHAADSRQDAFIVEGFADYAADLGVDARLGKRLYAGGLCFVPVLSPIDRIEELAAFGFLRVARPVGRMRSIGQVERSRPAPDLEPSPLPTAGPQLPDFRVAVFDGGLPDSHVLGRWATAHEPDEIGTPGAGQADHGHDVTSALLFGNLTPGQAAPQPYCHVDHFRVIDADAAADPFELYDVLSRIQDVLTDRQYEFLNLSIGPYMPVEDDEVHAWTAVLDEYLSDGRSLATIAVGNTGDDVEPRIQVPADCVNGVSIGAADTSRDGWKRASYSSVGPGRSPGVVKPDLLAFGGTQTEPFLVYEPDGVPGIARTMGTSFASPLALRSAVGLRAHFGSRLSPLAIKALLVHSSDDSSQPRVDVGWGRLPAAIDEMALCGDGMVRVVYQGELSPSKYLRAEVPLPQGELKGFVTIRATFCYATHVDPEDPGNYTRAGLEVTFRPHHQKFNDGAVDPKSQSFFKTGAFDPEHVLRGDAQKWETVLHREQRFRGSSLKRPVFDVHYNARDGGGPSRTSEPMRYALVLDVLSPRTPDLYDQVSSAYAGQLEALLPQLELPIQVRS
ncbi:S8 family peptidase [Nocardioides sp. CPCC 206347]|uniref:S8 family peptidase n=1 Tax=unclassified Nocardioides TaxID=2615069 RepID=UPI00361DDC34